MARCEHDGIDRRRLLTSGVAALAGWTLLSRSPNAAVRTWWDGSRPTPGDVQRTLVLVQLTGGNDGLSTVVPYADDAYHRARTATRIDPAQVLRLNDYLGLHPDLKGLRQVYDRGELGVVVGVGYPNPVRSHFKSMEIWHSAATDARSTAEGWIGRLAEAAWSAEQDPERIVHVGATAPFSLHSRAHPPIAFATPANYQWVAPDAGEGEAYARSAESSAGNATGVLARLRGVHADARESSLRIRGAIARYAPRKEYPDEEFARSMRVAAALIDARLGSRVISVELGGFDTHNNQRAEHDTAMKRLDTALTPFLEDLRGTPAGDETLVVAFSEFGRRVLENGSRGTDHGCAGPMFIAGRRAKGGVIGKHPSLTELDDGDLVHTTDFRSVYASVIEKWFGVEQTKVLGAQYPLLSIV